jgi:hypothetical protein
MTTVSINGNKIGQSLHPETIYHFQNQLTHELYIEAAKTSSTEEFIVEIINLQLDFILRAKIELPKLDHVVNRLVLAELPLEALIILLKMDTKNILAIDMQSISLCDTERQILFSYLAPLQKTINFTLPESWKGPLMAYCETLSKTAAESASASLSLSPHVKLSLLNTKSTQTIQVDTTMGYTSPRNNQ